MSKHVVIGGGTGFIGSALVDTFRIFGVNTTVVSRMPGPGRITWNELERCGLPEDISAVINVAGQNILDPRCRWTPGFKQNVWNSRVYTTKTLAKAVVHTKAETFATISGVAYYKPSEIEYTEDSKCEKYDFLSELCHEWERAAELSTNSNIRQFTIRSGVVLGRKGGMIGQIFLPFYFGLGGRIGTGKQYMPWIHIRDLINLFLFAIDTKDVSGILNGVAPQIITNEQFTKAFAAALWRPAVIPVPTFLLNMAFHKERAKIMTEGQKVIPKRVLDAGYEYEFPNIDAACKQFAKLIYIDDLF
ncbi:epimerase family protein SDR39U1 isoform X2 [Cephus cinctus]|uniref:Epimerase family protein SDR39U1 isoform X2 n=1 Tax=Cephus cinctus TaxID=211228 RepID=A0AAJ7BTN5_CEPCN|nr:epimerase family protein SDR39U1 isoform X2 [Cephus cinctus]